MINYNTQGMSSNRARSVRQRGHDDEATFINGLKLSPPIPGTDKNDARFNDGKTISLKGGSRLQYQNISPYSEKLNIMDAGARGVIITLAGKITGARHRTQKFIKGHVKYCGETAIEHMDVGYAVCVKKLGVIGVTVSIMRKGTKLPHEISIFSDEELKIRAAENAEPVAEEEGSE